VLKILCCNTHIKQASSYEPERKRQRVQAPQLQQQLQLQQQQLVPEVLLANLVQHGAFRNINPRLVGEHHGYLRKIDECTALQLRVENHAYTSLQHRAQYTAGFGFIMNTKDIVPLGDHLVTVLPKLSSVTFTVAGRFDQQLKFEVEPDMIVYDDVTKDVTMQLTATAADYKQLATAIRASVKADKSLNEGTMTFEIHFKRCGAIKFTAPFIWKSHAKFKTEDKAAKRTAQAENLQLDHHLTWQVSPTYFV
jgi:hypothetical protein